MATRLKLTKNFTIEEWIDVEGFNGFYKISNLGNVKSLKRKKEILMNTDVNWSGYERVSLSSKKFSIHRLVAQSFIPNPKNKPQVNHINGIKNDNRVENLEWVTCSENIKHAYDNNLKSKESIWKNRERSNIKNSKTVLDTLFGIYYDSVTDAAKYNGFKKSSLTNMLNGHRVNKTKLILV